MAYGKPRFYKSNLERELDRFAPTVAKRLRSDPFALKLHEQIVAELLERL